MVVILEQQNLIEKTLNYSVSAKWDPGDYPRHVNFLAFDISLRPTSCMEIDLFQT